MELIILYLYKFGSILSLSLIHFTYKTPRYLSYTPHTKLSHTPSKTPRYLSYSPHTKHKLPRILSLDGASYRSVSTQQATYCSIATGQDYSQALMGVCNAADPGTSRDIQDLCLEM